MSVVEVKPYGGVRRPSAVFLLPAEATYQEMYDFNERLREVLPNVDFAITTEDVKVIVLDEINNKEANTER